VTIAADVQERFDERLRAGLWLGQRVPVNANSLMSAPPLTVRNPFPYYAYAPAQACAAHCGDARFLLMQTD
jgi:hypothetical protein